MVFLKIVNKANTSIHKKVRRVTEYKRQPQGIKQDICILLIQKIDHYIDDTQ